MVSNVIGQERHAEVLQLIGRIAWVSFGLSVVISSVLNLFPEVVLGVYGQGEAFVKEGVPVLRVASIALLFMSFSTVWLNGVTGTGKTTVNLLIETISIVAYSVYVYVVLEYYRMPITWGWASEWLYWIMMFAMSYVYLRSGRWKKEVI
jgi:Na+-driven multidrug efflux pump